MSELEHKLDDIQWCEKELIYLIAEGGDADWRRERIVERLEMVAEELAAENGEDPAENVEGDR